MAKAKSALRKRAEASGHKPVVLKPAMSVDLPKGFKPGRLVTVPILKQTDNATLYVRITDAIRESKIQTERKGTDGKAMKPADIMSVVDLTTNRPYTMIANSQLKSQLENTYPGEGYVQKCFAITPSAVQKGKAGRSFRSYFIQEIEPK